MVIPKGVIPALFLFPSWREARHSERLSMTVETVQTNTNTIQSATPNGTQASTATTNTTTDAAQTETPESFDKWISSQPESIRTLFDTHVDGLKSALDSERTSRKGLEKQLRDLSKQAEDGSELKTQLDKLASDVQQSDSRATFYEAAHEAGVKNLKLAWIAAKEYDVFDRRGEVDFAKLKQVAPELFAQPKTVTPPANAGSGANQNGVQQTSMNDFLRRSAGR